jgi:hypothetical protein
VDALQASPEHLVPVNFTTGPGIKEFRIIGMGALTFNLTINARKAQRLDTALYGLGRKPHHGLLAVVKSV